MDSCTRHIIQFICKQHGFSFAIAISADTHNHTHPHIYILHTGYILPHAPYMFNINIIIIPSPITLLLFIMLVG